MKNNHLFVAIYLSAAFLVTACGGGGGGGTVFTPVGTTGGTANVPSSPSSMSAAAASTQVTISWSTVSGATSYNLYWSTTSGVTKTSGSKFTGVSSPFTHSSLVNGTKYYYVLTAVNSAGESVESSQVFATPTATSLPPPPTKYTISGEIVGLASGQSIVLQNNAGDDLTVSTNGAFTFATPLAYNTDYNVTVFTQPANGQTCALATDRTYIGSSGAGTVTTKNVDRVRVSCYAVNTFAGSGAVGQGDAVGVDAVFDAPSGMAIDASGNLYVADAAGNVIRKITPAGAVTTLAGSIPGFVDATGPNARFDFYSYGNAYARDMAGVAVDSSGNVYVADVGNNVVRKITPAGAVTTLAGSGAAGYADGTGAAAQFNFLTGDASFGYSGYAGIAVDSSGNVYVADTANNRIRKITPAGVVTTLAGSTMGYTDATGTAAQFSWPQGIALDSLDNVYVVDYNNHVIRKITPAGVVSTYAGDPVYGAGYIDATGTAAQFWYPQGLAIDAAGTLYVTDYNKVIRSISPTGVVSTVAGRWTTGFADGPAIAAKFSLIQGIAVDASGNIYVADRGANKILKASIKPYGYKVGGHVVGLVSGSSLVLQNNGGDNLTVNTDGLFTFATPLTDISGAPSYNVTISSQPAGQTCTIVNNTGGFTTGDALTVSINCAEVSTLAGAGIAGYADGTGAAAQFNFAIDAFSFDKYTGMATDTSGNVYVADTTNHVIRKITPGGVVSTYGTGAFNAPEGVAVDGAGNIYVGGDGKISVISTTGVITTLAAMGGDIQGITVDPLGNVYVAGGAFSNIFKVTPAGVVTTLAGCSWSSYKNGIGTAACFKRPTSVALDAAGNLYVSDIDSSAIRKVAPDGQVTTFVGASEMGGYIGYPSGTGIGVQFYRPSAVASDAAGNVYVTDTWNNVVLVISPMGVVSTLAGPTAPATTAGFADGNGAAALFTYPNGVAVDAAGNVYVADSRNNVIRKIVQ